MEEKLKKLLGEKVFSEVMALDKNTSILVAGVYGPSGKTTAAVLLEKLGYTNVYELCDLMHFSQQKKNHYVSGFGYVIALNNIIPDNERRIDYAYDC